MLNIFFLQYYYYIIFVTAALVYITKFFDKKNKNIIFQEILHEYYISNFVVTIMKSILYIFFSTIIFMIIRIYLMQNPIYVTGFGEHNLSYLSLLKYGLIYIIFIIIIVIYYYILDKLFFKEILKLYLFCLNISLFTKIQEIFMFNYFEFFFGFLRVFCYRIYTLTFTTDFYGIGFDTGIKYVCDGESDFTLSNERLEPLAQFFMHKVKQYSQVRKVFQMLAYIFRFLYIHINHVYNAIPLFIAGYVLIIEIYNNNFVYSKFVLFFYFMFILKNKIKIFIYQRRPFYDFYLMRYYYKNSIPYKKQYKLKISSNNNVNTEENTNIERNKKKIIEYILNNFKYNLSVDHENTFGKKIKGIYNRLAIIFLLIILSSLLLSLKDTFVIICPLFNINTTFILIFILPLLPIMYCAYKTFYVKEYFEYHDFNNYEYSRKYHLAFWILVLIQLYIFWILIFKSRLLFMNSEILWDYIITIKKIYTTEEKVIYLYEYFDYILNIIPYSENANNIRHILRQIDFTLLINEATTLKNIQDFVINFILYYLNMEQYNFVKFILLYTNDLLLLYKSDFEQLYINPILQIIAALTFIHASFLFIEMLPIEYQKIIISFIINNNPQIVKGENIYVLLKNLIIKLIKDNIKEQANLIENL